MTVNKAVTAFAGTMVLVSVLLTWTVSTHWMWLTIFVGVNLLQSAFTNFCMAGNVFRRLGFEPS